MTAPVLIAALAGMCVVGGIVVIVRGWTRPALSLGQFERIATQPIKTRDRKGRLKAATYSDQVLAELELCEMTPDDFARARMLWALLFASLPTMFLLVVLVLPVIPIPAIFVALFAVLAGFGGWWYALIDLHNDAEKRREEFSEAIATYLDLVAMLVAGGAGVESALYEAVQPGRGAPFRMMHRTLSGANARHQSPWEALGALAERLGLADLEELCSAMELASGGSQVQHTLRVRATSLRERELNAEESDENAKSETLVYPVLLMFVGFLLLIGYPTLASLGSSG